MSVELACPYCFIEFSLSTRPGCSNYDIECDECGKEIEVYLVRIRSKRSRGNKRYNRREFDIRVVDRSGIEDFIQFDNACYEDFEMKQGDEVAFYYTNGCIRAIQNITIDEFYEISRSSCYIASCIYGSDSPEVAVLRRFRDNVLLPSKLGSRLVSVYYRFSSVVVLMVGSLSVFRLPVAAILFPIVRLLSHWEQRSCSEPLSRPASSHTNEHPDSA